MTIPKSVKEILTKIESHGFSAYVVGGCVRDYLMGTKPHDYDIASSASPNEIKNIFSGFNTVDTGIKHGTIGVVYNRTLYEITTYRTDGNYSDGRHPDSVSFVDDVREDLSRRDFTVNAMAADKDGVILDLFGGENDIESKIIRCVGEPDKRFCEDALRIMRAMRFSSVLGFRIEEETAESMHKNAYQLEKIAPERIKTETEKMLAGKALKEVLEEYPDVMGKAIPLTEGKDLSYVSDAMKKAKGSDILSWAIFISNAVDHDKEKARSLARYLRLDNKTRINTEKLIQLITSPLPDNVRQTAAFMSEHGDDFSLLLADFIYCDSFITNDKTQRKKAKSFSQNCKSVLSSEIPLKLSSLAIRGDDIKKLGCSDGKQIGIILDLLLTGVIQGDIENTRESLSEYATGLIRQSKQ
ncbi:MAG: CCA tRNA nucleotidyltransferase [Clostridia bacterium]|nr:CCA tRNA nucleotidyltransferase [Clostridia bacterium]